MQEKEGSKMQENYIFFNTLYAISPYKGIQTVWLPGDKEDGNVALDKNPIFLLSTSANCRCPQSAHHGKAPCDKDVVSFGFGICF